MTTGRINQVTSLRRRHGPDGTTANRALPRDETDHERHLSMDRVNDGTDIAKQRAPQTSTASESKEAPNGPTTLRFESDNAQNVRAPSRSHDKPFGASMGDM